MTTEQLIELWNQCDNEHWSELNRREPKLKFSKRRDLNAFLLLESILPGTKDYDMVISAEHDQIWLDINLEKLAKKITREQIVELICCGVFIDEDIKMLSLNV